MNDKEGKPDRFEIDGIEFVIDMSPKDRRPSKEGSFTLVKNSSYIAIYENLARSISPRGLLELGIFQGGSFVLFDKLFRPSRMAAVDLNPIPVQPLVDYARGREHRYLHFGVSQTDEKALVRIVEDELCGKLDLVVDDASHMCDLTRRSFELLFPLLQPGGAYIVEDWAWAHNPGYQGDGAPFANREALTNLLFEQILLMASTSQIAEITVSKPLYIIRKALRPGVPPADLWSGLLLRGRSLAKI